jgi:hypothetical protein
MQRPFLHTIFGEELIASEHKTVFEKVFWFGRKIVFFNIWGAQSDGM